ncbi:MAG TPA: amidohydrolase family protein [Dehalococcoidia bacterium]|nr:amidohydrolase family protein [Dehalococcoidia bacterium]
MSLTGDRFKKADIHIHIMASANEGGFISRSLLSKPWSKYMSYWLGLESDTVEEYISRLVSYIRESPLDIGVILACDAIYDEHGEVDPRTSFFVPNDVVLKVAGTHEELLPGVSIHPNRKDALEEIDRCVEAGAALLKWLPNTQVIDPSDKKYKAFYRKLSDYGLPLLSHSGFEFTMKAINQRLGDPNKLRLALEEGTTVISAHCGISYAGLSTRYLKTWLSLLKEYPTLYGDLAALSLGFGGRLIRKLLENQIASERLVNGSDFPVPPLRTVIDIFRRSNPFIRDYQIKTTLGVPDSVFYRGYQLIRRQ